VVFYSCKFYDKINNPLFFQIHPFHIINLNYVTGLLIEGYVELANHSNVQLSRTHKKLFLELINRKKD